MDSEINRLVDTYKNSVAAILTELQRMDLSVASRAQAQSTLKAIAVILADLSEESAAWVNANIPKAATEGITQAIIALGVVETAEEAEKIVKFNRVNSEMVKAAVADTQADLLAVTQNIDRKVRAAVRQATADSMRANLAKGVNGRRTISRDILDRMRQALGNAVNTGIIDSAGRRWKPETYVEMVTRTKLAQTHRDATMNEALSRGAMYGRISRHGATDACRFYEGTIVKLTPDAPGSYRYIGDLPRREIFHPRCRHVVSPVRDPVDLADSPLPNFEKADIPEEKLVGYALNKEHPTGKNKAIVFESALGYNVDNWKDLHDNVTANLPKFDATQKAADKFGQRYEVLLNLNGPNGKSADVTTAWIIRTGEDYPRLTSIYIK